MRKQIGGNCIGSTKVMITFVEASCYFICFVAMSVTFGKIICFQLPERLSRGSVFLFSVALGLHYQRFCLIGSDQIYDLRLRMPLFSIFSPGHAGKISYLSNKKHAVEIAETDRNLSIGTVTRIFRMMFAGINMFF